MAVVVNVYGKWDGKQIARAEKQLRGLKTEAAAGATGWRKYGATIASSGDKIATAGDKMSVVSLGLGAGFALSIKAASDLGETMNKVKVVFGKSADQIDSWSDSAATALGMSEQQAAEAAASFGLLLKGTGASQGEIAGMSKELVQLASDMSSFNNIPMAEALEKIRAGLVGETEPLRSVGIMMDDATLRAKAMALGLVKSTKEPLKPAIKLQAAYAAMFDSKAAKTMAGDFKNTSDSMANSLKILQASATDAGAKIGAVLVPAVTPLIHFAGSAATALGKLPGPMQKVVVGFGLMVVAAGPFLSITGRVLTGLEKIRDFKGLGKVAKVLDKLPSGGGIPGVGYTKDGKPIATPLTGGGIPGGAAGSAGALGSALSVALSAVTLSVSVVAITGAAAHLLGQGRTKPGQAALAPGSATRPGYEIRAGVGRYGVVMVPVLPEKKDFEAAIAKIQIQASTATGQAFRDSIRELDALRALAKKPIILGDIDKKHTDSELRSIRDRIVSEMGLTVKQADDVMATMFKDWRPQDVLVPKINKAALATERRIDVLRGRAGKDIKMGALDTANWLNALSSVSSTLDGVQNKVRQVTNAATAHAKPSRGGAGGHHDVGGAGASGMAGGGFVPRTRGGLLRVLGEGNEGEWVVPESKVTRFARAALGSTGGDTYVTYELGGIHVGTLQGVDRAAAERHARDILSILKAELRKDELQVAGLGY